MKLYLWEHPYHVPYGESVVIVMAENIKEAREIALRSKPNSFSDTLQYILDAQKKTLGKPRSTRVASALHIKWEE